MIITIAISKKFNIGHASEISEFTFESITIDEADLAKVAEIIQSKINALNLILNKSLSAQLHDQVA